jgi:hypothetical protein
MTSQDRTGPRYLAGAQAANFWPIPGGRASWPDRVRLVRRGRRSTIFFSVPSPVRFRLGWLGPSAAAACAGALVAGIVDGAWAGERIVAAAGFVALLAAPALFVASVIARGLYAGWAPAERGLLAREEGGGSPRFAGWLAMIWLGALTLAWAAFQGTWLLAAWTAFKPLSIGFAAPILVVGATLVIVIVSHPTARLLASLARWIDRRWRKRGWRTLLTPRKIIAGAIGGTLVVGYVLWRIVVRPRLGPIDTSPLHAPVAGIAAALLVHAVWSSLGRARVLIGAALAALVGVAIAGAVVAQIRAPRLTLAIWGKQPVARLAIEALFDTNTIRGRVSLDDVRPAPLPSRDHPDIILIVIDTVRADHTPPYGGLAEMPILRELGMRGSVFNWAFAPSNDTPRSIASMMTGVAPNRVRGDLGAPVRLDPRHIMLAERLRAAGYETAAFTCCELWHDLGHGYDHLVVEPSGPKLGFEARTWIEQRDRRPGNRPLFVTLHLVEPREWTSRLSDRATDPDRSAAYDASLAAADAIAKDALAGFARSAPIAIVTSDHGEGLGDHDHPAHASDLYNSQIRVPLVIAGPGIKAQHIAETVSSTDLVPTILELAGYQPPRDRSLDARSFADLATGRRLSTPDGGIAFAMASGAIDHRAVPSGSADQRAAASGVITAADGTIRAGATLIRGRWKLIDSGVSYEIYDLQVDPTEHSNVISTHGPLAIELRALLDARRAATSPF